jgi:cytochrome c nitrite reductase small subunit
MRIALGIAIGLLAGIGAYTFLYAKGASYLTNDPAACANCHIMEPQYDGWLVSPHRAVAGCNDCHTPPGLIPKYATKASNGFWHSYAFTTGRFHEPIQIKERNRRVTEKACRKCHEPMVLALEGPDPHRSGQEIACIRCHSDVGHP